MEILKTHKANSMKKHLTIGGSLRRVLQQRSGRFARGMTSQEPVSPTVYNGSGDLVKKAGVSLGVAENYQTLVQDSTFVQSSVSPSGNMMGDSSYAGFLHSGPSGTVAVESVVQTGTHILGSDLPPPAQVVVENTPVGSCRLLCNWYGFWKAFGLDHNRADLIWNERTRQELRESLLDVEKERTEDIVPECSMVEITPGHDNSPQISWNYAELLVFHMYMGPSFCINRSYLTS